MPRSMFRLTRTIPALGAAVLVAVALSACGGSSLPGNAVAKVGGTPITKTTFDHWIAIAAASSQQTTTTKPAVPVPPNYTACIAQERALSAQPAQGQAAPTDAELKQECVSEYNSFKSEVLEYLITADWVLMESKDQGIKESDATVLKGFDAVKKQSFTTAAAYTAFLQQSSQTQSDLLLREKLLLLSARLQKKVDSKVPAATRAQIASYYAAHGSTYDAPESRDILVVLTKTEAQAQAARSAIAGGTSFADEAKAVSIDDASKNAGAAIDGVKQGQVTQALDSAIFSAPLHKLQGPVRTPLGYYVFQVTKATPAVTVALARASASIASTLLTTHQTAAFNKYLANFTKRWKAKTNCRTGFVVQYCKGYKAPKTSSTPATGTTAG
jgi:foldase protein PrsA